MSDHAHDHEHHRFQAHHFDTGEQQFQAGKLGMWLFLATEVLFFSGMFCAYTVYRAAHPEVFETAAQFLNPWLGAANTLVLLASSLSVAWAVRCAQLNKQKGLLYNLVFTLVCAGVFMGVKSVEYALKFKEGLYWRGSFTWTEGSHPDLTETHADLQTLGLVLAGVGVGLVVLGVVLGANAIGRRWALYALGATVLGAAVGCLAGNAYTIYYEAQHHNDSAAHGTDHDHEHADDHDEGEDFEGTADEASEHDGLDHEEGAEEELDIEVTDSTDGGEEETAVTETTTTTASTQSQYYVEQNVEYGGEGPKFPGVFFSIYYAMTGVHAIHILAGIGVFVWIVSRAARGHFEPDYYGPVEYTGLYWHLVDLIWIYLFPLLYLIQ